MGFRYIKRLPGPDEIKREMPLERHLKAVKKERDDAISAVLTGKSAQFIVLIGPCSADNEKAVLEYIHRLAQLQDQVRGSLILIPRIYTNKPRTTGEGYKGMMHQPDPNEKPNIAEGIRAIRRMHLRAIKETHLTPADEMLYPTNYPYLDDLLSYVTVGARSVENQQHRLTVSGIDVPVGMKNPTSGDLAVLFNSIRAAQLPHIFIYNGWEVKTSGNPMAHAILRGAVDHHGQNIPNYHYEDLVSCAERYLAKALVNPAIVIDTNHSNSNKRFDEQPRIALEVAQSIKHSSLLKKVVKGLMIESYLSDGADDPSKKSYGRSITDPCLGWEKSKRLILDLAEILF